MLEPFTRLTGVAAPLLEHDVNTDQIAPVGGGARLSENYAETLFRNRRSRADGPPDPAFFLNQPQYAAPSILVTGRNFGCGSSRESAIWALKAVGITCLIGRSFADLFKENCLQNGVLAITLDGPVADRFEAAVVTVAGASPFTVDLVERRISGPGALELSFDIPEAERTRLLEGLDDIGLTLKHRAEIEAFEQRLAVRLPWAQQADASTL